MLGRRLSDNMGKRVDWDTKLPILLQLRAEGKTYAECGFLLGCGKNAIHEKLKKFARPYAAKVASSGYSGRWTEEALTEPWAHYRARKVAERERLSAQTA